MMRVRPRFDKIKSDKTYSKNILYKIDGSIRLPVTEGDKDGRKAKVKETVVLEYNLSEHQYGIFAHEYRNPIIDKRGCKTADILACVVDEERKQIDSTVLDIKSNISAFSDDLLREGAMITVIKEVRDFIEQIHQEILHKNSFMIYYIDDGYEEIEHIGIATKRFEPEKFREASDQLEHMKNTPESSALTLPEMKLKLLLNPYLHESKKLRDFADKLVYINGKGYDLNVHILTPISDNEWAVTLQV